MRILLLEDELAVGEIILAFLKRWDMDALLAQSPQEAMDVLDANQIDLLVTDLKMPEMSGIELVRKLRQGGRHRDLPVLMISGRADRQDIIEATETGISDFVAKPFQPEELRKRIISVYRDHKRLIAEQRIQRIWDERQASVLETPGPQVVFGEPIQKLEDLRDAGNRSVAAYLHNACEAIAELNRSYRSLNLGYVIQDNTLDIIMPLERHAARKWIKLMLLSARCSGKPVLLVRLFTINRRDDPTVLLICDRIDEITPDEHEGLKRLGIKVLKRSNLNQERLGRLLERHVARKMRRPPPAPEAEAVRPGEVRSRIIDDIEAMTTLPSLPQVYQRILELSRDPDSDLRDWTRAIQLDPMTSAVVVRHANTLAYGFRGRVADIDRAVILLGKETVSGLVASEAMRQTFTTVQEQGFDLEGFWLHNLAVGFAAHILALPVDDAGSSADPEGGFAALGVSDETRELLRKTDLARRVRLDHGRENPFVGGIMHDIGKGVMVQSYPGLFPLLLTALEKRNWSSPMLAVEEEVAGGLTHPVVGEILARRWGLEDEMCEVILHHHQPDIDDTFAFLIGAADIIGQAMYPFPRGGRYPVAQALEDGDLARVSHFLPAEFCDNPLVGLAEFVTLARALIPTVDYLTRKMRFSLSR